MPVIGDDSYGSRELHIQCTSVGCLWRVTVASGASSLITCVSRYLTCDRYAWQPMFHYYFLGREGTRTGRLLQYSIHLTATTTSTFRYSISLFGRHHHLPEGLGVNKIISSFCVLYLSRLHCFLIHSLHSVNLAQSNPLCFHTASPLL